MISFCMISSFWRLTGNAAIDNEVVHQPYKKTDTIPLNRLVDSENPQYTTFYQSGVSYYFVVTAVNPYGESGFSNEVNVIN